MNRRAALKYFVIITAGAALLPTCQPASKKITAYNNIPIDEEQLAMLASISAIILPGTATPGSKEISAHLFSLQMLNDCYGQKDRNRFLKGMNDFDKNAQEQYHHSFTQCSNEECKAIITSINAQKDADDDEAYFYKTIKGLTIQAYTTSKYYLTNVQEYKLIPGKFQASVAV